MFALRRITLAARPSPLLCRPAAPFSDMLKDKERGEEKAYFSKKDAKLLKALVEKMEKRDALKQEKAQQHSAVCDDLDHIFENHGLDKAGDAQLLYQELMEWKRTEY